MAKLGRKLKNVNPEDVETLARMFCTNKEIASFCNIHVDTLVDRFSKELEKGRQNGKISLRRWQLQCAEKGNATLLIWLGKQYLDQKDVQVIDIDNLKPIQVSYNLDQIKEAAKKYEGK